ncbi:hypothetical protein ACHAPM_010300 [Fusarium culmorum]
MTGALYNTAILLSIVTLVASQDSSNTTASNPTIYQGSYDYKYHGCYNETTQIQDSAEDRALADGTHLVKAGKMTVPMCLDFCTSNGTQYKYAGLEWSRLLGNAGVLHTCQAFQQSSAMMIVRTRARVTRLRFVEDHSD